MAFKNFNRNKNELVMLSTTTDKDGIESEMWTKIKCDDESWIDEMSFNDIFEAQKAQIHFETGVDIKNLEIIGIYRRVRWYLHG